VIEEEIEIPMSDGMSEGFLYRAEGSGRLPGVLYLPDIGGIRASNREMARRLAGAGYSVLMPNAFYRTRRLPLFDFKPDFTGPDERTTKRLAELRGPLTPEAVERDASEYVDFLAAQDCVSAGGMGVVGFFLLLGRHGDADGGGAAGQDRRGRLVPWRRALHGGAHEPASPPAAHQGAPLFRARGSGPQHAARGDRKV
jgi:carboxymethylenebutenolidase